MAIETQNESAAVRPAIQQGRFPESQRPMNFSLMFPIAKMNAAANDSPVDGFCPRWREGGPTILFGAQQPRMLRLTALFADAWDAGWQADPAVANERSKALDAACLAVGHDPHGLIRTGGAQVRHGPARLPLEAGQRRPRRHGGHHARLRRPRPA